MLLVPVHAAAGLMIPRLVGSTIDLLSADGPGVAAALGQACWWLLALGAVESAARYVSRKTLIDASRHVERELKNELVTHIQRLPMHWFDRARTGDITSRLTQDIELIRFVMGPLLLHGGSALCLIPAGLWLMAGMNVPVMLSVAAAGALLFVALSAMLPRLHRWSKDAQSAIGLVSQQAQEDFAGIRVVHQFDRTARERAALASANRRYLLANLRMVRMRSLLHATTHSATGLVVCAVLLVGGLQTIAGAMSVGELFQFLGYLALMTFPLEVLGWILATMPRALAAAERVQEVFAEPRERNTGRQIALTGRIEARQLTFSYPGSEKPVLRDVSFVLQHGEKLALVGAIGSGKSTLLALLLGYYEPPRGMLLVDGIDVLDLAPATLRAHFAYAEQEPVLFSDSIADNITFAAPEADAARLAHAVTAAALDQDLAQLPQGLATVVGERGITLSGGQRQRVAIARALYAKRSALLLDDPLSALDPLTERRIAAHLAASTERSVILATHRLSAAMDATLVLVLDQGAVCERGTPSELLANNGRFALAYRMQHEAEALASEREVGA